MGRPSFRAHHSHSPATRYKGFSLWCSHFFDLTQRKASKILNVDAIPYKNLTSDMESESSQTQPIGHNLLSRLAARTLRRLSGQNRRIPRGSTRIVTVLAGRVMRQL